MSGDRYLITDQHAPYFITCTVIHWIDLFSRKDYKDIIVDSLNYCVREKSLTLYGWVIMQPYSFGWPVRSPNWDVRVFAGFQEVYLQKIHHDHGEYFREQERMAIG